MGNCLSGSNGNQDEATASHRVVQPSSLAIDEAESQPARSQVDYRELGLPDLYPLNGQTAEGSFEDAHEFQCLAQHSDPQAFLANWLIPNRVLLGRYPFLEPSQCSNLEHGEQQIRTLLEAGVTTFVCLQAEIPAQMDIPEGGAPTSSGIFYAYKPIASEIIRPMDAHAEANVSSLNGAQPIAGHDLQLEFLYSPIVDYEIPSTKEVHSLLEKVIARLAKGEVIYIHCWGGRGRAGTIGACLLTTVYGIHSEEALKRVQKAFNTRGERPGNSPQTEGQRNFVRNYVHRGIL